MITLTQLRELARKQFPAIQPSLVHLLVAWARTDAEGNLATLLRPAHFDTLRFAAALVPFLEYPTEEDKALFVECIASVTGETVGGTHLLQALCEHPTHRLTRALAAAGLDCQKLAVMLRADRPTAMAAVGIEVDTGADSPLRRYGRDLTALAVKGAFAELSARPKETEQLLEVLMRKRKGNPLITGKAGVGKTALVERLAVEIHQSPGHPLATYHLVEVSMGKLVAGTRYRGDFEARVEALMQAMEQDAPAILFIDEIHLLLGAGRAEGAAMDGANLLKPFLARDDFRVIGATTHQEYQRHIARDEALARRFQLIRLQEPDRETVYTMVSRQAEALAVYHSVELDEAMVRQAIELTERHLPNRHQPDKSIDLLDSAAVAVRRREGTRLALDDLLGTLAHMTGTPVGVLSGEDRGVLRRLAQALKARVIGQDAAIERVVASLVHRRMDLGSADRPFGVFLFAGDTGVGKTELARAIAATFLGDARKLVQLDLGEYSSPAAVHKLIGAPAGYVGSEEEGVLIQALQAHPSAVLLFDEIEKADPDVHQLLLGLLDNGRISSARGEHFDARQCVIILTTNALTAEELGRRPIGFGGTSEVLPDPAELLSRTFPREFLGRMDEIIPFKRLNQKVLRAILRLRLEEAVARLRQKGLRLVYADERLLEHLMAHLRQERSGARGIARLLERQLLQPLALALLEAEPGEETVIALEDTFYRTGAIVPKPQVKKIIHVP